MNYAYKPSLNEYNHFMSKHPLQINDEPPHRLMRPELGMQKHAFQPEL
jgi:hypothetical protein